MLKKAQAKGIKVVLLASKIKSQDYDALVTVNDEDFGKAGAEWLAKKLNGKGKIIALNGISGISASDDRWAGAQEVFKAYPDIEVVLANHRVVRVGSIAPALPEIGSEIVLMKRRMLLGYTTYRWEGDLRPPPQPASGPTPVSLH